MLSCGVFCPISSLPLGSSSGPHFPGTSLLLAQGRLSIHDALVEFDEDYCALWVLVGSHGMGGYSSGLECQLELNLAQLSPCGVPD